MRGAVASEAAIDGKLPPPTAGLLGELAGALGSARTAFSSFFDLLSLEARRAGLALMWMVAWGLVAAICVGGAWLGLMVALAMWAVSLGMSPIAAAVAIAAINLAAGIALFYACIRMSRDLLFSATRRQLAGEIPVKRALP